MYNNRAVENIISNRINQSFCSIRLNWLISKLDQSLDHPYRNAWCLRVRNLGEKSPVNKTPGLSGNICRCRSWRVRRRWERGGCWGECLRMKLQLNLWKINTADGVPNGVNWLKRYRRSPYTLMTVPSLNFIPFDPPMVSLNAALFANSCIYQRWIGRSYHFQLDVPW